MPSADEPFYVGEEVRYYRDAARLTEHDYVVVLDHDERNNLYYVQHENGHCEWVLAGWLEAEPGSDYPDPPREDFHSDLGTTPDYGG